VQNHEKRITNKCASMIKEVQKIKRIA